MRFASSVEKKPDENVYSFLGSSAVENSQDLKGVNPESFYT